MCQNERHSVANSLADGWVGTDRLTVNGEFIGRTIRHGGRLVYRNLPLRGNPFGLSSASIATSSRR